MAMAPNPGWCERHRCTHVSGKVCVPPPPPNHAGPAPENLVVVDTSGWSPVDDRARTEDAAAVAAALEAGAKAAKVTERQLLEALRLMGEWGNDVLRATATDPSGVDPMWCDVHECDTRECPKVRDVVLCQGAPYRPGTDPAGEAAAHHATDGEPQGLVDRRRLLDRLRARVAIDKEIAAMVEEYSSRAGAGGGVDVDLDWCVSCQRDGGYCEPIARLTDERRTPRHRAKGGGYLCRWCGGFVDSYGLMPPPPVLRARHEGRKITQALVSEALRDVARPGKKRKRNRR